MPPRITSSSDSALEIPCDVLIIGATSSNEGPQLDARGSEIDKALDGHLLAYLRDSSYKSGVGDIAIVPTLGNVAARAVAVVGLGERSSLGEGVLRRAAGSVGRRLRDRRHLVSALHDWVPTDQGAGAAAEGLLLGSYRFATYKAKPDPSKIETITFVGDVTDSALGRARARAEATALARDLTNEPANSLTPSLLAERAVSMGQASGVEVTVWDENELERRGFGGILGVGKGSIEPPRFIQMRYSPENAAGKVVLVGKGITFDSGGLSLKDAKGMEQMKTDMGGAAAVIGTMSALSRLDTKVEVLGLVASSENMPSGSAIRPGDVITHFGGRTTEVNNTDAEGRLVLGDAVAFACQQKPDAIVDAATLTGAIMVALGAKATGVFCNDDKLAEELDEAARAAGERAWRMPLYEDYMSDLDSEVADSKNSSGRWGGAIVGALFIKHFLDGDIPWAHLDIAGPTRAESDYDEVPKGGTGAACRTLLSWIEARGAR